MREGWRKITLNRPEKLNSFTVELHRQLAAALDEAAADETCRAVLLTGAGRGFCAGQDLEEIGSEPSAVGDLLREHYNPLIRRIRALPKPVVCAVNGVAAGAGANLAFACDIVLAARRAKFIQAFAKIALVPDSGGTWFLPRLVGEARARALALTGEAVSAEQAESWGMIWRAVDDEELASEAEKLLAHLATQPTAALGLIKRALLASASNTLDAQLDLEAELQEAAAGMPDYAEGIAAFAEKRPARFTGQGA
ncbi:2-(1,2-epoxy-1,2-dihydrophenyl)acetyl-CoA isomerase PaaG [Enterovirga aerilata]|uniref:2-(1,2-epoxy-1,2-dihydrophenyl)acetyl-CoA isomerase n=1 Tax=Enterovirga aerilata TaxID=2730920 RepID=A0A849HX87_9HYPH|nr:2-(1,2-epoxy-1,2-dihydrophenyl)acetyl-CoA isomerase PaaG [Enterovirga sp. DB1703]NNM71722.1 2-(1,2-epoxy-1,2-dihydrophenyl)acetyl-CoA isomerase [Enterovirga sp. DB1703]